MTSLTTEPPMTGYHLLLGLLLWALTGPLPTHAWSLPPSTVDHEVFVVAYDPDHPDHSDLVPIWYTLTITPSQTAMVLEFPSAEPQIQSDLAYAIRESLLILAESAGLPYWTWTIRFTIPEEISSLAGGSGSAMIALAILADLQDHPRDPQYVVSGSIDHLGYLTRIKGLESKLTATANTHHTLISYTRLPATWDEDTRPWIWAATAYEAYYYLTGHEFPNPTWTAYPPHRLLRFNKPSPHASRMAIRAR